jgi:hypothetical protein
LSKLRLAAADRERLGGPEFLRSPLDSVTVREAIELQKLGYPTPTTLAKALATRDEGPDFAAWVTLVWLALRRAGVECEAATLDFDIVGLEFLPDEEPVEPKASGKAPAREGSTNSARKSSTSGETSGVKSTSTDSPS